MSDQSMQTITSDIEKDLLDLIIKNLKQHTLHTNEAKQVASEFVSFLPLQDKKDLLEKLYKLSQDHTETAGLYTKFAQPIEEDERQKKLALMSEHLKNGQIENALAVAKGEINNGK